MKNTYYILTWIAVYISAAIGSMYGGLIGAEYLVNHSLYITGIIVSFMTAIACLCFIKD